MIRPELDALLQGALDGTLTHDERAELARELQANPAARARAARLTELAALIDSLGPAEAPPGLVGNVLAQQILAGDAEVDIALADLAGDLRGRQEGDLDVVAALDAGPVFAVVIRQADGKPGARQHFQRLILETAF